MTIIEDNLKRLKIKYSIATYFCIVPIVFLTINTLSDVVLFLCFIWCMSGVYHILDKLNEIENKRINYKSGYLDAIDKVDEKLKNIIKTKK